MHIKKELLQISSMPIDIAGNKLEPEERGARRMAVGSFDAKMQLGGKVGNIQGGVAQYKTALEVANEERSPCFMCKHFNQDAWKRYKLACETSNDMSKRKELNEARAMLLGTQNAELHRRHAGMDGSTDVEHALSALGLCETLTEIHKEPIIVHPISHCPPEVCSDTNPLGLFVPKDVVAERLGSANFDSIMRAAQGKHR